MRLSISLTTFHILGIPEDHVYKVLTEIAHFHAVTYHIIQQHPGGIKKFKEDDPTWNITDFYDMFAGENMKDMIT